MQATPHAPQLAGSEPKSTHVPPQLPAGHPHVPDRQLIEVGQPPQLSVPPQPSDGAPQVQPRAAQVVGVQPQTFGFPPPPQVCGGAQAPQFATVRGSPQESFPLTGPQVVASLAQNVASLSQRQPHWCG